MQPSVQTQSDAKPEFSESLNSLQATLDRSLCQFFPGLSLALAFHPAQAPKRNRLSASEMATTIRLYDFDLAHLPIAVQSVGVLTVALAAVKHHGGKREKNNNTTNPGFLACRECALKRRKIKQSKAHAILDGDVLVVLPECLLQVCGPR